MIERPPRIERRAEPLPYPAAEVRDDLPAAPYPQNGSIWIGPIEETAFRHDPHTNPHVGWAVRQVVYDDGARPAVRVERRLEAAKAWAEKQWPEIIGWSTFGLGRARLHWYAIVASSAALESRR